MRFSISRLCVALSMLSTSRVGRPFWWRWSAKEDLINAIALNSSMFNGARMIGPAIAGIVVAKIGEGWCFFSDAVSYIAVIIGLFMMSVSPREIKPIDSPIEHVIEGFRFVRET